MRTPASIMLVEDSIDDYEAMMRSLKRNHVMNPVHWCRSGQEALDALHGIAKPGQDTPPVRPDLILLDLNMPGLDGRHVLRVIKADAALCAIPVVVLTTSADENDISKCYAMGANTYIQKPVHLEGLIDAMGRLKEYWFGVAILPDRHAAL
jgi:CheY-like chemotaxis protein